MSEEKKRLDSGKRRLLRGLGAGGLLLAGGGLSVPRARADEPFHIFQITYRGETDVERGFSDYLTQRGVDFKITFRNIDRDRTKVPEMVEEIRQLKPDLVYTWSTPVTLGVVGTYDNDDPAKYINDIPVVFTIVAAPVKSKVVPTFQSSGRNVTGTYHVVPLDAQLRAMESYRPFKALGVLYTPTEQNSVALVGELREEAKAKGFELIERTFKLNDAGEPIVDGYEEMLKEIKAAGATWLYYPPDTFLGVNYDKVKATLSDIGLPAFGATELAIKKGGALAGLVCRYYSVGQLTAFKAEQILVKGVPPADIPVETLKRFSLIVNIDIAKQLKLYPPLAMLNYAEVITG